MAEAIILRVAKLADDFPEAGQLGGAGRELSKLKKTFSFLRSIVPDAEKRILGGVRGITPWLGNLKDAFYDTEDLLEEWNLELEVMQLRESPSKDEKLKQVIPSSSSPSRKPDIGLEMSARAKEIRQRLEGIAAYGRYLRLRECAEDVRVERRERLDSSVYDEEIIGREDAKSAIMKLLLHSDTDEQISFLSIWGDSGIGKTALARCLYEDEMVKKHFDLRIWVNDFCNLEGELRKIRGRETTEREDDVLRLQRYLLVIDDLRPEDAQQWRSLKSLSIGGARGSKILITTCHQYLAEATSTSLSYCLEALRTESSVDLLMKMTCQEEKEIRNPIKVDVRRRIVKMCDGIPLAIRMIGSLLFSKKTEEEWLHLEREISGFSLNSISLSLIIELCYGHLPSQLKQCFAFCSLFPRDWVIDKQKLMSLWMAAGFIQPIDNVDQDIKDIAHDYFMDLLRRNFFQDCTKDELGNVMSCKMHLLVHDLARHVAGTEYKNIYHSLRDIDRRTRHASWNSTLNLSEVDPYIHRAYCLRTFIKTSQRKGLGCETQMGEKTLHELISSFKFLCALDLHDSGIEKLSSSICELKHLTFLDLSENVGIIRLPDSVTRLETLQVLKLNMCYNLKELPRDIRKLVNLRQLEISNCNALSYMPQGMGELTLLRTLTDFILPGDDSCPKNYSGLGELNRLNNLRGSLRIEVKGEIKYAVAESNAANLKEKNSLVSLVLVFAGKESDEVLLTELQPSLNLRSLEIRCYGGKRFPSWMSCMPKLVQLRLFDCARCNSLPSLGELASLKHLEIGELPIAEYTESDNHTLSSLPNLSTLRICKSPNLERNPPLVHLKELKPPSFPLEPLQILVATTELVIGIDDQTVALSEFEVLQ